MILSGLTRPFTKKLSGLADPEQWLIDWVGGGTMTSAGEKISAETALTCAAVKAAVTVLAETVASVSLDVFKYRKSGGRDLATDHPVQRLLHDEPNEETASSTFRETLQGHLGTWGNGFAEIQRLRNGEPMAIWQRLPRPSRTKPFRAASDGRIYYECRDERGQLEANLPARDVLHIPGLGFDGLIGYDPIGHLREAIGLNKGAERYAAELFANDARPNGVVSVEGELSNKAYRRAKRQFNEDRVAHGKRHRIMLLEGGAKFAEAQMNPENVQCIEARRFGIEEVARAYRISPHLLQDLTHGTFSNITELGRQFIIYTMMPWFTRWRAELNRKLLVEPYRARFNYKAFLEGDHKTRAEFHFRLWQMGALTVNEIRAIEGENPVGPEGDIRFVPVNMMPLERALKEPEPPPPPPGPEDQKDGKDGAEEEPAPGEEPEEPNGSGDGGEEQSPATGLPRLGDPYPGNAFENAFEAAARGVLVEALGRMMRKEANAARRAARNGPSWHGWAEAFYGRHEATVAAAILPGCAALAVARGHAEEAGSEARRMAADHCRLSRTELADAILQNGDGLAEQVERITAAWDPEQRLEVIEHAVAHPA